MSVRLATHEDVPTMVNIIEEYYALTEYAKKIKFNRMNVAELFYAAINGGMMDVTVYDSDGIAAVMAVQYVVFPGDHNVRTGNEMIMVTNPSHPNKGMAFRALIRDAEVRAREKGCASLSVSVTRVGVTDEFNPEALDRVLQAGGFTTQEVRFIKEL